MNAIHLIEYDTYSLGKYAMTYSIQNNAEAQLTHAYNGHDQSIYYQWAAWFAVQGFPVFRLTPDAKIPLKGTNGFKDATTDTSILFSWFGDTQNRLNLGVVPGTGFIVLDVDAKGTAHKHNGLGSLAVLEEKYGALPNTFTVQTPSGGRHLYFSLPISAHGGVGKSDGTETAGIAPGIDIRSNSSGYVVAPPSTFKGKGYAPIDVNAPIAELPSPWVDALLALKDAPTLPLNGHNGNTSTGYNEISVLTALRGIDLTDFRDPELFDLTNGGTGEYGSQQLDEVRQAITHLNPNCDRVAWLRVGAALYGFGHNGFDVWNEWSKGGVSYNEATIRRDWERTAPGKFGDGVGFKPSYIFKLAQDAGWVNPKAKANRVNGSPVQHSVQAANTERVDTLTGEVLQKSAGTITGELVHDDPSRGEGAAGVSVISGEAVVITLENYDKIKANEQNYKTILAKMTESMNKEYASTISGGKSRIMRRVPDFAFGNRMKTEFLDPKQLKDMFLHELVVTGFQQRQDGTLSNKAIYENKLGAWMKQRDCLRYPRGIFMHPIRPGGVGPNHEGAYNLWQGFGVEAKQGGDWSSIDHHIKHVLANGDEDVYNYILNWCAFTIQYPERPVKTVIAFRGDKQIGKGRFADFLINVWGEHGLPITNPEHLVGKFNAHLEHTCFLFADEAFYANDKKHEGILKAVITERYKMSERKGIDATLTVNYLKIMMATNSDYIAPTTSDDVRFMVQDVANTYKGNREYFNKLTKDIDSKDVQAAFLYDMNTRDITDFNPQTIPVTKALRDQREYSLKPVWQWWQDCLGAGYVTSFTDNGLTHHNKWELKYTLDELYKSYQEWVTKQHLPHHQILTQTKFRNAIANEANGVADAPAYGTLYKGEQKRWYTVGTLEEATVKFNERHIG